MGSEETISGAIIRAATVAPGALSPAGATAGQVAMVQLVDDALAVEWASLVAPAQATAVPFFRVRSYLGGVASGTLIDDTYFEGGANFPAGKTQRAWTLYASGPGGSFLFDTVGVEHVIWLRLGLTNTTSSAVTANVWLPAWDNGTTVRWDGAIVLQSPAFDTAATFTLDAGQSAVYELFFYNCQSGDGQYDTTNQGVFEAFCDALDQAGIVFYDPGA